MPDQTLPLPDGRVVGYADYGSADGTGVLWCHGGPGSRLEPAAFAPDAAESGLRIIGIDRPGYGLSSPKPERTIADWVPDGLAVADALALDRFVTVGCSTGGAYALALAALAPARVLGVVACCALTDMRWEEGRATMSGPASVGIWEAPNRDAAMKIGVETFGEDGSKMLNPGDAPAVELSPSDMALFADPDFVAGMASAIPAMFAQGVVGYVDDRRADGPGWGSFDVRAITCPVIVVHGGSDTICAVVQAHHTAEIVPNAALRISPELGHFSILSQVQPAVLDLLR
jgi:pimeloyl-ACP methyl ester carboxylesterase